MRTRIKCLYPGRKEKLTNGFVSGDNGIWQTEFYSRCCLIAAAHARTVSVFFNISDEQLKGIGVGVFDNISAARAAVPS